MSLPPDVRKYMALRLLESVDPDEAFDMASKSSLRRSRCRLRRTQGRPLPRDACRGCARPLRGQVGCPFMTGRINYTPVAQQQLNELDDRITEAASAEIARR